MATILLLDDHDANARWRLPGCGARATVCSRRPMPTQRSKSSAPASGSGAGRRAPGDPQRVRLRHHARRLRPSSAPSHLQRARLSDGRSARAAQATASSTSSASPRAAGNPDLVSSALAGQPFVPTHGDGSDKFSMELFVGRSARSCGGAPWRSSRSRATRTAPERNHHATRNARAALEQEVSKRLCAEDELNHANRRLHEQAMRDVLTGLYTGAT